MNIIRDPNQAGMSTHAIQMVPLLTHWGIRRCNIAGCKESPTTIVSAIPDCPTFGMCEGHFQEAINTAGNYKLNLEF
jgi:hypothetical protein